MDTIVFANEIQVVLFNEELSGQISDGHWENSRPNDHYKRPCGADVKWHESTEKQGPNFFPKRSYNFASKDLIDCVGERMIDSVKAHLWVNQYFFAENPLRKMFMGAAQAKSGALTRIRKIVAKDEMTVFNSMDEASKACRVLYDLKMVDKKISSFAEREFCNKQDEYHAWKELRDAGITVELIDGFDKSFKAITFTKKDLRRELKEMSVIFNKGRK